MHPTKCFLSSHGGNLLAPASQLIPVASLRDDKFHDHCGVFAIFGHPEAAKLTYLGLYALQHRGQESAGIAVSDGETVTCYKQMGQVAETFTEPVLAGLAGPHAIGHTRYSTAGDTALKNAQPLMVTCQKGQVGEINQARKRIEKIQKS